LPGHGPLRWIPCRERNPLKQGFAKWTHNQ
jgi:hypothetical protein